MVEIRDLDRQTDFRNVSYYFKGKDSSPINLIGFRGPLNLYKNIIKGNIKQSKAEEYRKQFKPNPTETTRGNPKNKSEDF